MKNKAFWFYLLLFGFIFIYCLGVQAYDYDLWARLIVGKHFFQTLSIMKQDVVSYIPTDIWYDHEWGSGVIFYAMMHFFSHYGLIFLQIALLSSIYYFISKTVKLKSKEPYNVLFYICSFLALSMVCYQLIRCQLFTFLFFTIFLFIFEVERKTKNSNLLWILPLLMLFWNNIHGGCVAGLGLFVFYILGEFLNKNSIKKYFLPFLACFPILLINPWGIGYLKYLFMAATMPRPEIIEWQNLFLYIFNYAYIEFKIFAFILVCTEIFYLIRFRPKIDWTKYIITFSTVILAIEHIKHIPLAVITLTVFFYDDFYKVFNLFTLEIFKKKPYVITKNVLFFIILGTFALSNLSFYKIKPYVEWTKYPIRIIEFIKINDIRGNILTNFAQGSFTSYKLYPHNKIYMDGRYEELYFKETFDDLQNFVNMRRNWQNLLEKYPPDMIILEKQLPICKYLKESSDWTVLFDDNNFYLFVKTKDVKDSYTNSPMDLEYYQKHLFDTDINFMIE